MQHLRHKLSCWKFSHHLPGGTCVWRGLDERFSGGSVARGEFSDCQGASDLDAHWYSIQGGSNESSGLREQMKTPVRWPDVMIPYLIPAGNLWDVTVSASDKRKQERSDHQGTSESCPLVRSSDRLWSVVRWSSQLFKKPLGWDLMWDFGISPDPMKLWIENSWWRICRIKPDTSSQTICYVWKQTL